MDEAVALLDGRIDAAIADRDVVSERRRREEEILRENALLRSQLTALQSQIDAMREAFAAERASLFAEVNTDPLTGVLTRRGFERATDAELARARGGPVSVLMIDIDHFKAVNDRGGHAFGDRVLAGLGGVLRHTFRRAGDVVGRLGGEEFAVVMAAPLAAARVRAERLRADLAAAALRRPDGGLVTVSIGVATVQSLESKREALLEAADTALYRAKRAGRDRVVSIEDPEELVRVVADVDDEADVDEGFDAEMLREVASAGGSEPATAGDQGRAVVGDVVHGIAVAAGAPAVPPASAGPGTGPRVPTASTQTGPAAQPVAGARAVAAPAAPEGPARRLVRE